MKPVGTIGKVGNVLPGEYLDSVAVPVDTVLWPLPSTTGGRTGPIWRTLTGSWTNGRDVFWTLEADGLYELLRVSSRAEGDQVHQDDLDSLPVGTVLIDINGLVAQSYQSFIRRPAQVCWTSTIGGHLDRAEAWRYLEEPVIVLRLPLINEGVDRERA